jgi:ATP synthase protein I
MISIKQLPHARCDAASSLRRNAYNRYNPAVCFCRKRATHAASRARVISPLKTRPIRTVLLWQVIATALIAAVAGLWAGGDAAISAALGGSVNLVAGVAYALLLGLGLGAGPGRSAGASLVAMFRAEAGKVLVIIGGLWLTLAMYQEVVAAAYFTAFTITVIVFSMAFFVRDENKANGN